MRRYPLDNKELLETLDKSSLTEETMKCWDGLRAYLLGGGKGSLARDIFESIIDSIDQEKAEAAARIRELESERERLLLLASLAPLRYGPAVGETLVEMKENVRRTDLFNSGDLSLVWVNTGDLLLHLTAPFVPTSSVTAGPQYDAAGSAYIDEADTRNAAD